MAETETESSALSIFLTRVKEQSFTILLMLVGLWYQHTMWQRDHDFLLEQLESWEKKNMALIDAERSRMIERENYLMAQRDQFVDILKDQVVWQRATEGTNK